MVDTVRTYDALLALFADNGAGDISPQDLRDFLATMRGARGATYISTPAATTISGASTWFKAAGTTTDFGTLRQFSGKTALGVNNRLRYDGTGTMDCSILGSFTLDPAGATKTIELCIMFHDESAGTNTQVAHSFVRYILGGAGIIQRGGIVVAELSLDTNDYVEFWIRNITDATNVTVNNLHLRAQGFLT